MFIIASNVSMFVHVNVQQSRVDRGVGVSVFFFAGSIFTQTYSYQTNNVDVYLTLATFKAQLLWRPLRPN